MQNVRSTYPSALLINMSCDETLEIWKKKRSQTFYVFCFLTFVVGTEWGIILPTLYVYLKSEIQATNYNIWYGFINAAYWMMSGVGSLTITKYADSTRNIRQCIIFICSVAALGNFIYSIPYSPVFPMVGRAMQGLGDSMVPVINGEIIRVFPEDLVMKS